jgi:AraC-like DNA-binding protein
MSKQPTVETLRVKNMVCDRCIRVVREELETLGLQVRSVELGEAIIEPRAGVIDHSAIRQMLLTNGFELLDDRRSQIVEQTKKEILRLVRQDHNGRSNVKLSAQLARTLNHNYHSLSELFSSVQGITIERFTILQRIERAKELLKYGEFTLSQIADRLGYSSVQHLSSQFKQITGMTPSFFKAQSSSRRTPIDQVGHIHRL